MSTRPHALPTVLDGLRVRSHGRRAAYRPTSKPSPPYGVYGTSAVTAITARGAGSLEVKDIPGTLVASQIDTVISDVGAAAAKTGMLPSLDTVAAVADRIRHSRDRWLSCWTPCCRIGDDEASQSWRASGPPWCRSLCVATPNAREAGLLTGREVETLDDARSAAAAIVEMGAACAVVTGGSFTGPATDILYDGTEFRAFTSQRVDTANDRGVGAAFSAAIAAGLANGLDVRNAVSQAKKYVTGALRHALPIGPRGPIDHLHEMRAGTQ